KVDERSNWRDTTQEKPRAASSLRGFFATSAGAWKFPAHKLQRLFPTLERSFQLRVLNRRQHVAKLRAGLIAESNQVLSGQQRIWPDLLRRSLLQAFADEVIERQVAVTAQAIHVMQFQMLVEPRQSQKAFQSRCLHALRIGKAHVVGHQGSDLPGVFVGAMQTTAN